jgi:hypothetical protein
MNVGFEIDTLVQGGVATMLLLFVMVLVMGGMCLIIYSICEHVEGEFKTTVFRIAVAVAMVFLGGAAGPAACQMFKSIW